MCRRRSWSRGSYPDTVVEPGGDAFEVVYVELDWYDGLRAGLADVDAVPQYFRAVRDDAASAVLKESRLSMRRCRHWRVGADSSISSMLSQVTDYARMP